METAFMLGLICSTVSSMIIIWSTFVKNKEDMTQIQVFNPVFGSLANIFFGSYSAAVVDGVNIIRNYLTYKGKLNKVITTLCIIFYILFGLIFNSKGWLGILPILASSTYVIFLAKSKNAQILRYGLLLNQVLWFMHNTYIKAYPAMMAETIIIMVTVFNILRCGKKHHKNN